MAKPLQLTPEDKLKQLQALCWDYAVDKIHALSDLNLKDNPEPFKKSDFVKSAELKAGETINFEKIQDILRTLTMLGPTTKNQKIEDLSLQLNQAEILADALPEKPSDDKAFDNFTAAFAKAKAALEGKQDSATKTFLKAIAAILMTLTVVLAPIAFGLFRDMKRQHKDSRAVKEMDKTLRAENSISNAHTEPTEQRIGEQDQDSDLDGELQGQSSLQLG